MPMCMSYPLGYSVVLAAECLEAINNMSERLIHNVFLVEELGVPKHRGGGDHIWGLYPYRSE